MRIAVVGDASSINVRRWTQSLACAGADVHVVSYEEPLAIAWGAPIVDHQLPARLDRGRLRYVVGIPSVRRRLRAIDPDVVCGYYATGYGMLAGYSGVRPVVQVCVGSDVVPEPPRPVVQRLAGLHLRRADLVLAWSPHLIDAAVALGARRDRCHVQPRGIPVDTFLAHRPAALPPLPLRVITTRALTDDKRIDVLIDAWIEAALPGATLTIVGDGPARSALEDRAMPAGPSIRFVGTVANDELPAVLAEHHVYVSTKPVDGVSASLMEVMAIGLYPLVVDNGANAPWLTDRATGRLLPVSASAFAEALREVAADPGLMQDARVRNLQVVQERADQDVNARRFLDLFESLVSRAR